MKRDTMNWKLNRFPGTDGKDRSMCWWNCREQVSAWACSRVPGIMRWAKTLPSSTPHWSKESIFHITPWVNTAMLIKGDELAQRRRRQAFDSNYVGRSIALAYSMRRPANPPSPSALTWSEVLPRRALPLAQKHWQSVCHDDGRAGGAAAQSR